MTTPDIHSLNHVGIVVRDMDATAARYEAMGFVLTPYSPHSGAWKPGESVAPLRSGNRCVMFESNYLEILASEDPASPSPRLDGYLRHHQGGHIICFGSEDLVSVGKRLVASGLTNSGVIALQREIETPDGMRTAKFERMQFSPEDSPEGYIQAARHLTPEYIYQPRYAGHPNGCTELSNAVLIVDDVAGFADKYTRYTGITPVLLDDTLSFRFPLCSRLTLMDSATAVKKVPGTLHPPIPGIAAIGFECADTRKQADLLRARRIPFIEVDHRLVVAAEEASGIAVVFEQRP